MEAIWALQVLLRLAADPKRWTSVNAPLSASSALNWPGRAHGVNS
jgi:hypothetical protein